MLLARKASVNLLGVFHSAFYCCGVCGVTTELIIMRQMSDRHLTVVKY